MNYLPKWAEPPERDGELNAEMEIKNYDASFPSTISLLACHFSWPKNYSATS